MISMGPDRRGNGRSRIGVFVCHCGTNIANVVDVAAVVRAAEAMPAVHLAADYKFMCSDPGQSLIRKAVVRHGLDRVVVAACSPRMHEPTFRKACAEAGLNPYLFEMANIREHCAWVHEDRAAATEKAIDLVRAAVARAHWLRPLEPRTVPVTPRVLVVGGGVAGIQAALEIADAGTKVVLVEREQSLGGRMAQLDKTFPTLDCSACILTPKMVQVAQHPNIELLTYSEVERVEGSIGNFEVTVRRRATSVDPALCTGCGVCIEKCPRKVPNAFDEGRSQRRAIYRLFPQAVPNTPVIDRAECTFFRKPGKCRVCEKVCEAGAIRWDDRDQLVTVKAGAIVVATGADLIDAAELGRWGWGRHPDVLTGIEFERVNNATGPTGGRIVKADGGEPQSVAILHCVGSRDRNGREYCSRVCCMYALKFAHLIREKIPAAAVYQFYLDMRCFGKGYEEFYHRLLEEGVKFVRGKAARVEHGTVGDEDGKLVVVAEATTLGVNLRVPVDMVVLATAMTPRRDAAEVARRFGIGRSPDGFFLEKHPKLEPVATATDGVFLAGTCQAPRDIPDTVAQGAAAASSAQSLVARGQVDIEGAVAEVREDACSGCRVCQDVCPYGAIGFAAERRVAVVDASRCKGCGTCAATCPSGAIQAHHFDDRQVLAQIDALFA